MSKSDRRGKVSADPSSKLRATLRSKWNMYLMVGAIRTVSTITPAVRFAQAGR